MGCILAIFSLAYNQIKMVKPKIIKVLNKALIIAIVITILSFIFPIVPCKTAPVIAEPVYVWSMCKLPNPIGEQLLGLSTKYYATTTDSLTGFLIHFIIIFAIITIIFILIRKKAGKVLDLTHK